MVLRVIHNYYVDKMWIKNCPPYIFYKNRIKHQLAHRNPRSTKKMQIYVTNPLTKTRKLNCGFWKQKVTRGWGQKILVSSWKLRWTVFIQLPVEFAMWKLFGKIFWKIFIIYMKEKKQVCVQAQNIMEVREWQ